MSPDMTAYFTVVGALSALTLFMIGLLLSGRSTKEDQSLPLWARSLGETVEGLAAIVMNAAALITLLLLSPLLALLFLVSAMLMLAVFLILQVLRGIWWLWGVLKP